MIAITEKLSTSNTLPLYEILETVSLSSQLRSVLTAIHSFMCGNEHCWPSLHRIAKRAGLSVRQVRRYINKLIELGLLKKETRTSRTNLYSITINNEPITPTMPEMAPEISSETSSEIVPETAPEIIPKVIHSEVIPEVTQEITPEVAPEITSEVIPEIAQEVTLQPIAETTIEIAPKIVSEVLPEVTPEVTPKTTPEPTQEITQAPKKAQAPAPELEIKGGVTPMTGGGDTGVTHNLKPNIKLKNTTSCGFEIPFDTPFEASLIGKLPIPELQKAVYKCYKQALELGGIRNPHAYLQTLVQKALTGEFTEPSPTTINLATSSPTTTPVAVMGQAHKPFPKEKEPLNQTKEGFKKGMAAVKAALRKTVSFELQHKTGNVEQTT